jgi:membrane-associated phospholipid phosphatase
MRYPAAMFKEFFHRLPANFLACFSGVNALFHLLAIAITYLLVTSGMDWWYYESTRHPALNGLALAAGGAGFVIPVALPLGIYVTGRLRGSAALVWAGAAAAQAVVVASVVSAAYKALTGRTQPVVTYYLASPSGIDNSREFHFGWLRNGIFWGWPSSHTAVACALALALILVIRRKAVGIVALMFAGFIALGASIGFHWLSDVAAGSIVGTLIGAVIGRSFQRRT